MPKDPVALRKQKIQQHQPCLALVKLWILRILLDLGGHREFIGRHGFSDDGLERLFDLEVPDEPFLGVDEGKLLRMLRDRYREIKRLRPGLDSGPLTENLHWLGSELGLTAAEKQVLAFVALMYEYPELENAATMLGDMGRNRLCRALGTILGTGTERMRKALHCESSLVRSGLVRLDSKSAYNIKNSLEVLEGLEDALLQSHADKRQILSEYFALSSAPEYGPGDFDHFVREYRILKAYLGSARRRRLVGVNILIYGRPGTGKTQFVRTLAKAINMPLYEIGMKKQDGEPRKGRERFSAYQLGQSLLARNKRCLIMFDEAEDVFPDSWHWIFGRDRSQDGRKAWINRLLEGNPVPAVWITNDVDCMDPATLRRFDVVMEFKAPMRRMRKKMLERYFEGMPVSQRWLDRLAGNEDLVPAFIGRAVRVVRNMGCRTTEEAERTFDYLIQNTLLVTGGKCKAVENNTVIPEYRLDLLNTEVDMERLAKGLTKSKEARLCLYGPPGTGKTAFGEYLARHLDRPLVKKPASAIISPFIGETEKNIARMFRMAEEEGAVLLLDEADGFLRDRRGAQRSWELTQVNELLVQMETFQGIFIASTNLMGELDQASLRRFDLKIHFGYLKAEQAWSLFTRTLELMEIKDQRKLAGLRQRLRELRNLTPGDFATVIRQQRVFAKRYSAEDLLQAIEAESKAKEDGSRRAIGFVA